MNLVENLVALFRVDSQVRGLRSRVDSAQRFLDTQSRKRDALRAERDELETRRRQVAATTHNLETEIAAVDERIEKLRNELNSATSNKQYTAVLNEMTTIKDQRSELEQKTMAEMERAEILDAEIAGLQAQISEREANVETAKGRLAERTAEVGSRLAELESERDAAAAAVPPGDLQTFDQLADAYDGEAMATLLEIDRRRREYACGACNMHAPFESVSILIGGGNTVVTCSACGRILYMQEELKGEIVKR